MAELNEELTRVARESVAEVRSLYFPEEKVGKCAWALLFKYCDAQGMLPEDDPETSVARSAGLHALIKAVMREPQS